VTQLLAASDFLRAGDVLLLAMAAGSSAAVPPYQVADCILGLFAQQEVVLADALLRRLEAADGSGELAVSRLDGSWAVRLTILRELQALHGKIDVGLWLTFVRCAKTQNFLPAFLAVERELAADRSLRRTLKNTAPVLSQTSTVPRASVLARIGLALSAVAVVGAIRWLLLSGVFGFLGSATEPWQALDASITSGACSEIRTEWRDYVSSIRTGRALSGDRARYRARRNKALATCPALASDLPERP
jgi:hypothetical protein